MWFKLSIIFAFVSTIFSSGISQHSIARDWNEINLGAIRNDFARPTVHARNLFHVSLGMYDAWAAYDDVADTYFLGKDIHGYRCLFNGLPEIEDIEEARDEAISYAAYRILYQRYERSPGARNTIGNMNALMAEKGYDLSITDTTYQTGVPAHLGNYLAAKILDYGNNDGANELGFYRNQYYQPSNPPLVIQFPGNPDIQDMNRWQPLSLRLFIDQSGNLIPGDTPEFLSPEWGNVFPFSLKEDQMTVIKRDNEEYKVYHDPGPPVYLDSIGSSESEAYKWGNLLVSIWGSHLDPDDGVMVDISPASLGNINNFPRGFEGLYNFYNLIEGGDASVGHTENPVTGLPYEPNIVPRGDYARVLAEFWADGPDSETPPGHWFSIHNTVSDHPLFERKYMGQGEALSPLEWDVKAYMVLGGALHDSAISAWGIKGAYDYIRPVSAIRGMSEYGQSSDSDLPNFDIRGLPLVEGFVEMVMIDDTLAGDNGENIGKVKLYSWKGPEFIEEPETDVAGVDWILAEEWWPYQRPSFVTPPFAGYVSGHSTFSRAAAEVMTLITGDAFFPGGVGEFVAPKDEFLVFENGPSQDIVLQWATYRDASDQTSLSRIWGGIHPPIDDIPGRIIGAQIGINAFTKANRYFTGLSTSVNEVKNGPQLIEKVNPNPALRGANINITHSDLEADVDIELFDMMGRKVYESSVRNDNNSFEMLLPLTISKGTYVLHVKTGSKIASKKVIIQ